METYFTKFPTITYANNEIRDLSRRVVLGNNLRQIPTAFYPYDIEHDQRSDVVSYNYYKDQDLDWLIYLTNGIIDPYFGWYLTEDEFTNFITKKYGGMDIAQQTISYWTTNWMDTDINVTISYYGRLPQILQKYFIPVWGPKNIIAYKRRPESWIMNTNQIMSVYVSDTSVFKINDLVQSVNAIEQVVGTGQIVGIDATNFLVQVGNVQGFWETPLVNSLQVRNDTTKDVPVGVIESKQINITDAEAVYWTPVSCYDMEREINEQRKTIMLLDPGYVQDAARGLTKLLKE